MLDEWCKLENREGVAEAIRRMNLSGVVIERYRFDVFGAPSITDGSGNAMSGTAYGNRFMFTGREFLTELGLYDYRNRVSSPDLGRFLQTNPIRFDAGDVNIYRYCGNDPVNGVTPYKNLSRNAKKGYFQ